MNGTHLLPSLWANFDRLLDSWSDLPRLTAGAVPPVNVWEDGDAFHLEAELPGMSQEQVHVAVTNRNQVTIQGERRFEEDGKGRWHRRERGFGRFQRVLRLPLPVDADKVEAKLEDGLFRVTLPKGEEARPRRIAVKAEA